MPNTTIPIGSLFTNTLAMKQAGMKSPTASTGPSFGAMLDAVNNKTDVTPKGLSTVAQPTAEEKFMKYQNMTVAQKVRASYLAEMGVSEEQLAAMSPADRKAIEDKIAEKIKEQLAKATGGSVKDPTVASVGVQALTEGAV